MLTRTPTSVWIVKRKGKRGMAYRLRWVDPRTGKWESEGVGRDLTYARERKNQVREQLRDGLMGKLPLVTVSDLVGKLDAFMAGKSSATIQRTKESLSLLDKLCEVGSIVEIDRAVIMSLRARRLGKGIAPATANKNLREIRSALSYALDAGLLRANPMLGWKGLMVPQPQKVVRVVELEEYRKLLEACKDPVISVMVMVSYRAGLRQSEVRHLRWDAVDLEHGTVHVVNVPEAGEFTKSRKNRSLPMHPEVTAAFARLWAGVPKAIADGRIVASVPHVFCWPGGKTYKKDWVGRQFKILVKNAGIRYCTFHDLRRSFATMAQRAGVDRNVVKDLGGWSDVKVLSDYYTGDLQSVFDDAMKKIIQKEGA